MGGTKKKTSKTTSKAKARSSKAPVKRASGELGDDELEKVAGGVTSKFLTTDLATAVSPFASAHKEEIEVESFSWGSVQLDKDLTLRKK